MENSVIVRLVPKEGVNVATFEEAFGEHSELRGRGRARRQARRQDRRMTRIKNRAERKRAKQEMRSEQQEARQTRKDVRTTRRADRQGLRSEARQLRRDTAQQGRMGRESLREDEEPIEENDTVMDQTDEQPSDEQEAESAPPADINQDEYDDETMSIEGTPSEEIHPDILDLTNRIVWNQEAMGAHNNAAESLNGIYIQLGSNNEARAKNASQMAEVKSGIDGHKMEAQKHEERIGHLKSMLKKYGDHPHIKRGMKIAKIKLEKVKEARREKKDRKKAMETFVPKSMNATIKRDKISVPPTKTGKIIEMMSGAEGGEKGSTVIVNTGMSTTTKVVLIVAAAGIGYVLAKKYKLI